MEDTPLRAELKELHRGRGIRRPAVRSWLGPELQGFLGLTATTPDDDARNALVQLIREHTGAFPRDLRYLFLVAAGVLVDHPFLEERLAVAEKALDRSARVLRRRLRTAERLLADSLLQTYSEGTGPFEDKGWQWEEHHFDLVLRDSARLTLNRSLRALADHQKYIHESFVIPGPLAPGTAMSFRARSGFSVLDVDHSSPNSWGVTLELPHTLTREQRQGLGGRLLRPDDDQPVDGLLREPLGGPVPVGRGGLPDAEQGDRVARILGRLHHGLGRQRLARPLEAMGGQAEGAERSAAQGPRRPVGRVAQLVHGVEHPGPGRRGDPVRAV